MSFHKELSYLIFEICFCIFVIVLGYIIWNNFDASNYEIAKSYANTKEIILDIDDCENIVVSDNENDVESNMLYLHNISGKNNNAKLMLKIDKNNTLFKDNTILKIDNNYYILNDLEFTNDNNYIYIIIDEFIFDSYETKELEIKILTKEKINSNIGEYLNYEFITHL